MDRRIFIAGAAGALAAAPALAVGRGKPQNAASVPLVTTYVTNVGDVLGAHAPGVANGQLVHLKPEPRAYHRDTIVVVSESERPLGYLPINQSRILAPMIAAGIPLRAEVVEVKTTPRPTIRLAIAIAQATA